MSSHFNSVKHFSHPHPLVLSNYETTVICSSCTLQASGWIHSCKDCNYFLHVECLNLPEKHPHPCDCTHPLYLLAKPRFPTESCTACNTLCRGFSYVCKECDIHLDIACAGMPLIIRHRSHNHTLSLTFSPRNQSNCKICSKVIGDKQWRYRCNMCNFDAHLGCGNSHQTVGNSTTSQNINTAKRGAVTSIAPLLAKGVVVGVGSVMAQGVVRSGYNHWQTASTNADTTSVGNGGALLQEGAVADTTNVGGGGSLLQEGAVVDTGAGGFWDTMGDVVSGFFL